MDNFDNNVESNSVVDLELEVREDVADPTADLPCAGMLNNGVDPIWAGDAEVMAVGPRTGADACQAEAQTCGHTVRGSLSSAGPAEVRPSQASVVLARCAGVEQTASHPVGYPHFGLQTTASGAVFVDQSREWGSELWFYGSMHL